MSSAPDIFGTPSPVLNQPACIGTQYPDENGKAVNVQLNPQSIVTAQTLRTLNENFLNNLHHLNKPYAIRPADPKKPQTVGEKILNALKSLGRLVRSLFHGSKNAENLLQKHLNELTKSANDRNIECSPGEYQIIWEQIENNFDEIKNLLPSSKEKHKPPLNDCLKFYKDLAKNLKIAEEYHRLKQSLTEAKADVEKGVSLEVSDQAVFSDDFLDTAQKTLKKELDALEKRLSLPSESRPAPTRTSPSKGIFGKAKPRSEHPNAYVYYDNPHSTEHVFSEEQLKTLSELRAAIFEKTKKAESKDFHNKF